MQFHAILSNTAHPEYGVATIPFPLPREEYDHSIDLLSALEIGDAVMQDCKVDEITDGYPVLRRLEGQSVNVDELDYLAMRLDSFRLGVYTFEDEQMNDEPVAYELPKLPYIPLAKQEANFNREDFIIDYWKNKWRQGHLWATYMLGKLYRDGVEIPQNLQEAERWFRISAEAGNKVSEYALGKMLLPDHPGSALHWLEESAEHGCDYAMYYLGKLCLAGEIVQKDVNTALEWFTQAAEHGNQYAQYALGKLYLQGREIPRDREKALRWLECSAAQGNNYAEYLLDRADEYRDPSIMLSATKLLHHMSRIFQANSVPSANPQGICMDSKRRKKLLEKRLALGHKINDHEEKVQIHM